MFMDVVVVNLHYFSVREAEIMLGKWSKTYNTVHTNVLLGRGEVTGFSIHKSRQQVKGLW